MIFKDFFTKGRTTPHLMKTFSIYAFIALSIIVTKVLIARLYGQEELGIFSYFFALASVVFLFSSFEFPEAVTQIIVKEPAKLKRSLLYALIFIVPLTFLVVLPFVITDFFLADELKLSFVLYLMTYTFFYLAYSLLRGRQKFAEGSLYSLVNRLIFIVIIVLFARFSVSFPYVILGLSLALALAAIIALPRIISLWKNLPPAQEVKAKEVLTLAFSLFLMQSSFYLLRETDQVIIPYLVSFSQLGLYSAQSSLSNILRMVAYVFPVVVLPMAAISRYHLKESFFKVLKLLLPLVLLILAATYIFVPILYGPEYQDALLPIALVLSSALLVIYSYFNSILVGENKFSRPYLMFLLADFLLTLVFNTGLTIILVRSWGLIGAPLATALTVFAKIIFNVYGIKKLRVKNGRPV